MGIAYQPYGEALLMSAASGTAVDETEEPPLVGEAEAGPSNETQLWSGMSF